MANSVMGAGAAMPTIELENVTKFYKPDKQHRRGKKLETGVAEVNLTIRQGEFVFVIGSSGAGKSTLLNLIAGREKPSKGRVYVDDKDLHWMMKLNREKAARLFGMVRQEPALMRKRTVGDNLALAARIQVPKAESFAQIEARIKKVLGLVGMSGSGEKYPAELSIGECRRVELARALISSPPVLVLDELTANLDDDSIWDVFQLLHEINRRGTTVVMATHASQYVNIMRRRVITLVDGRVFGDVQKGRYGDVVEQKPQIFAAY